MRKLGLYIQVQADPEIRAKLQRVRPAVVLVHLDGGDLIPWIRQTLPDTFVVGRYWWSPADQDRLLYATGSALAEMMLHVKGAPQCQALMLFNEYLPSPYEAGYAQIEGKPAKPPDAGWYGRAQRYDVLQMEFREHLQRQGMEAVAWNYGAGNWEQAAWYRELQPLTWAGYRYFGHHVYGWPQLWAPEPWWLSNLDATLRVADAMADRVHIITELAVTRMYAGQGPDVGWLSEPQPLTLDAYAHDLGEVSGALCRRPHVWGAALFNAAPEATWRTFAVPAELAARLAALPECEQTTPDERPQTAMRFQIPIAAGRYTVSQWFGENPENYNNWGHEGLDLSAAAGTVVTASAAGVVAPLPRSDVYGRYVRLRHDGVFEDAKGERREAGRFETVYAHLSSVNVKPGQEVPAGGVVGQVGSTGRSTGNHLHFGLRLPGQKGTDRFWGYSDPAPWLGLKREAGGGRREAKTVLDEIRSRLAELEAMI